MIGIQNYEYIECRRLVIKVKTFARCWYFNMGHNSYIENKKRLTKTGVTPMTKIEIYSKSYCPYCKRAKATLTKLGLAYEEFEITNSNALTEEMQQRSGRKTVPQIFINDQHIGGGDDFHEALASGALTHLIGELA